MACVIKIASNNKEPTFLQGDLVGNSLKNFDRLITVVINELLRRTYLLDHTFVQYEQVILPLTV